MRVATSLALAEPSVVGRCWSGGGRGIARATDCSAQAPPDGVAVGDGARLPSGRAKLPMQGLDEFKNNTLLARAPRTQPRMRSPDVQVLDVLLRPARALAREGWAIIGCA